ncbi:hypothetical protein Sjap_019718 [Stephania japonica]|uniref:Protein kinase domain-containing protein n=1 Tax=Stephania japonica TaxID=461633 RepID=A0AAP0HZZ9_9MAGN
MRATTTTKIKREGEHDHGQEKTRRVVLSSSNRQPIIDVKSSSTLPSPGKQKKGKECVSSSRSNKCCCLGMGSSHSKKPPTHLYNHPPLPINPKQAPTTEVVPNKVSPDKRFIDRVQGYLSPRILSPRNRNLAALAAQAKLQGWYIEPHEVELHEQIGRGSTAFIYKATWRGIDVAVKCMYPNFFISNENGNAFFAQEIKTLSRQSHPFVLHLLGACLDPPEHGWLVTEFLSMTLRDWLHGNGAKREVERSVPLPPLADRVEKAMEIAKAMQYMHEQKPKLIHRDLKPSNIFMDDEMHVRVADFGAARFLREGEAATTGETGKNQLIHLMHTYI